jgi:hypothetical protein
MMWTFMTPWGPISFHFCADEARMLFWGAAGSLPFLGAAWFWVRSKFKKHVVAEQVAHHKCCHPEDKHDGHN